MLLTLRGCLKGPITAATLLFGTTAWDATGREVLAARGLGLRVDLANESFEDLLIRNSTWSPCLSAGRVFLASHEALGGTEAELPIEGAPISIKPGQSVCLRMGTPRQGEPEPEFIFFQQGRQVGLLRCLVAPQCPAMALESHPHDLWEVGEGLSFRYCGSIRP